MFEDDIKTEETGTENLQSSASGSMIITDDIKKELLGTATWTKFLSVIGFIMVGVIILSAFALIFYDIPAFNDLPLVKYSIKASGAVMLIITIVVMYPSVKMFKYTKSIRTAFETNDKKMLRKAIYEVRHFFKYWGVLIIMCFVFVAFHTFLITVVPMLMK